MPGDEDSAPAVQVRAGYCISRVDTTSKPSTSSAGVSHANITTIPAVSTHKSNTSVKALKQHGRTGRGHVDQAEQEPLANSGANYRQHNRAGTRKGGAGGGDGSGRNGRNSQGGGKAGNRGRHHWGDGKHAVTAMPHVPVTAAQDHLQRERIGGRRIRTGGVRNSSNLVKQQVRPETDTSSIRPSSAANVATFNEASRPQAQQEKSGYRRDRENPRGPGREGVTYEEVASPPIDIWNCSTHDMKDIATTISSTPSTRSDVQGRLGSQPRSPRNSLFRGDGRFVHKGHADHRQKHKQQREHHHGDHLQPTALMRSDVHSTVGRTGSPKKSGAGRERTQVSSIATSTRRGSWNNTACAPLATVVHSSDESKRSSLYSHEKMLPGSHDVSGQHFITSTKGLSAVAAGSAGAVYARGTCMTMCPQSEMLGRQAEAALSVFEATEDTAPLHFRRRKADPSKTVKKYRRSAAGRPMGSPDQLRPLSVLQHTSKYLVKNVFAEACENSNNEATSSFGRTAEGKGDKGDHGEVPSIASAYVFVEDRLRAVRQDLTVQGLGSAAKSAEVLKLAANFYVVSGYLMSDKPPDIFDKHLHTRELQGVFSSLADMFFQARGLGLPASCPVAGEDEYLSLQAVHALATAVSNHTDGKHPLAEAAGGKGVGSVFATTVSKLCAFSQPPVGVLGKGFAQRPAGVTLPETFGNGNGACVSRSCWRRQLDGV